MYKTNIMQNMSRRGIALLLFAIYAITLVISLSGMFMAQKASAISPETRPTLVGREIHMGLEGGHVKMMGTNIWGIETTTMDGFGDDQYADRVNIVNTIKSWGANHVRFRLQASDYNNETYMTKAEYLNRIQQWHDLITDAGMYFMPTWWDAHDGPYGGAAWGDTTSLNAGDTNYTQAFPMMTDVMSLFPNDPMVMYEPFNEPTGAVNDVQWVAAMKDTISHYRDNGYTGILLIDPRVWAHCYDDSDFDELEAHDAAQAGMNGTHQIIFTKHDYANEYSDPDAGFSSSEWLTNDGGCEDWQPDEHAIWESEFGNYNLNPSSVHPNWSDGATTFFHDSVCAPAGPLAGGSAFLFGPWLDSNAMTAADNTTPTLWGTQVDNNFLVPCDEPNGIGTLGNRVFYDKNKNGVYEPSDGDYGFQNVTLAIYAKSDNTCSVSGGDTPLFTQTTGTGGLYQFTILPTDDGNGANGAGARYAVVVTDTNGVLDNYTHTTGTADTDNNSQTSPVFCVNLTDTTNDIQYADFGYGDPAPGEPTGPGSITGSNGAGGLAATGQSVAITVASAATLLAVGLVLLFRRKQTHAPRWIR